MVTEFKHLHQSEEQDPIARLRLRLRGELVALGDDGYEEVRTVFWSNVDKRPALIVRAEDETDVIAAVEYARETGAPLAVRSGGHGFAGHGLVEGGIVIEFSRMKALRIDPVRRVARVQPGLTWLEYGTAAAAHNLATTSGDVGSVGVGGLTVGGGIGWMVRKYGLTIDHLLSFDIVTADGRLLRASADEHPDLFWAVRGGGGNFGVITSLEFKLQPVAQILGGSVFYSAKDGARIIKAAAEYAAQAPEELTTMVMLIHGPPLPYMPEEHYGELLVWVAVCYTGDLAEGERVVAPLRSLAEPVVDLIQPMPYPGMFSLYDGLVAPGRRLAVRSLYLDEVDDHVANAMVDNMRVGEPGTVLTQLRVLGGAMARRPDGGSAFAHRDAHFMLSLISEWEDAAMDSERRAWVERYFAQLQDRATGVYVNFLQDEGAARIRQAYSPATLGQLAAIKAEYDPTNLFRSNQNITPA